MKPGLIAPHHCAVSARAVSRTSTSLPSRFRVRMRKLVTSSTPTVVPHTTGMVMGTSMASAGKINKVDVKPTDVTVLDGLRATRLVPAGGLSICRRFCAGRASATAAGATRRPESNLDAIGGSARQIRFSGCARAWPLKPILGHAARADRRPHSPSTPGAGRSA